MTEVRGTETFYIVFYGHIDLHIVEKNLNTDVVNRSTQVDPNATIGLLALSRCPAW